MLMSLGLVVAFLAGTLAAQPATLPAPSDAESSLQWMFQAALTHHGSSPNGGIAPAATDMIILEHLEIVDPYRGPILATVSDADGNLSAYEIIVERKGLDWKVKATQLSEKQRRPSADEAEAD